MPSHCDWRSSGSRRESREKTFNQLSPLYVRPAVLVNLDTLSEASIEAFEGFPALNANPAS